jgi:hypothetical protein
MAAQIRCQLEPLGRIQLHSVLTATQSMGFVKNDHVPFASLLNLL